MFEFFKPWFRNVSESKFLNGLDCFGSETYNKTICFGGEIALCREKKKAKQYFQITVEKDRYTDCSGGLISVNLSWGGWGRTLDLCINKIMSCFTSKV